MCMCSRPFANRKKRQMIRATKVNQMRMSINIHVQWFCSSHTHTHTHPKWRTRPSFCDINKLCHNAQMCVCQQLLWYQVKLHCSCTKLAKMGKILNEICQTRWSYWVQKKNVSSINFNHGKYWLTRHQLNIPYGNRTVNINDSRRY